MIRAKADFLSAAAIRALADTRGRLLLRVTPGARVEGLEIGAGVLLVRVRTKPEDGKANAAVLGLLAQVLDEATSRLQVLRGASGRNKLVQLPL